MDDEGYSGPGKTKITGKRRDLSSPASSTLLVSMVRADSVESGEPRGHSADTCPFLTTPLQCTRVIQQLRFELGYTFRALRVQRVAFVHSVSHLCMKWTDKVTMIKRRWMMERYALL